MSRRPYKTSSVSSATAAHVVTEEDSGRAGGRVQAARAAAHVPGAGPDRTGDEHPGGRDHLAGPADQDHDGIAGRAGRSGTAFRRSALARTWLAGRFPVALLFRARTGL